MNRRLDMLFSRSGAVRFGANGFGLPPSCGTTSTGESEGSSFLQAVVGGSEIQDYLDLYLVHWPFPNFHPPGCDVTSRSKDAKPYLHASFMKTWRKMEELVHFGFGAAYWDFEYDGPQAQAGSAGRTDQARSQ